MPLDSSFAASLALFIALSTATFIDEANDNNEVTLEYYQNKRFPRRSFGSFLKGALRPERIVGGVEAEVGRYPYMVSLIFDYTTGAGGQYAPFCGGSLVAPEWVLTAAHCLGYSTHVLLGHHDFNNVPETAEKIAVRYEVAHPAYDAYTYDNDVAMLRLEAPASSSFAPVRMNGDDGTANELSSDGDDAVTVMGWGATQMGGCATDVLLEVEVRTVNNETCSEAYGGLITRSMLCAGASGKDSCQGDSGGPMIRKGTDASSDVIVGVVSWGYGCACPGYPGVYADVAALREFVDHTLQHLGGFPDDGFDYGGCDAANPGLVGNYECDLDNNVTECNNDGKDCDSCPYPDDGFDYGDCNVGACFIGDGICQDFSSIYKCNFDGGDCKQNCPFPDDGFDYAGCQVDFPCFVGDRQCDTIGDYNTPSCNYDGGDCDKGFFYLFGSLMRVNK